VTGTGTPDPQTAKERKEKARDLAYEEGRKDAKTQQGFEQIAEHFKELNGSVADIHGDLDKMNARQDATEAAQKTRDAVAAAIKDQVAAAGAAQVTTRTFVLGCIGLALTFAALIGVIHP
jgi:uncharacterized protein (DUF3084 family)